MGVISGGSGGGGGGAVILRVNGLSGTSISATLGSKTVSGTIPYAGVLELNLGKVGQWAVTARSGSYSFTQQVKAFTYGITEIWALAKKAFYDCTTTEIQAIAKSGMVSQYWSIGDYHTITMKTGEVIDVAVADFNHDVTPGGVTIPVTLVMKQALKDGGRIHSSQSTAGGYPECEFRKNVLPSIVSNFPDEWQNIMTTARKNSIAYSSSGHPIVTSDDKAWMLSAQEVLGSTSFNGYMCYDDGSTLYPIFSSNESRIRMSNGANCAWWTRSPRGNYDRCTSYCYVREDGAVLSSDNNATATTMYSVPMKYCLGFCVG